MASAPTRFCRAPSKASGYKKFSKVGLRRAASQSKRLRRRRWLPNQLKDWLTRATSRREHEVLEHVIAGQLNKQIAGDLGTGEHTVKVHRARVMEKMKVESLAELVRLVERARAPRR